MRTDSQVMEVSKRNVPGSSVGSYILELIAEESETVRIGARGALRIEPGYFYYCGSAFGPGGLEARIGRHFKTKKSHHWHIDYLRSRLAIREAWISRDAVNREHVWAALLDGMRLSKVAMPGFGSSDCRCPAHLFYFKRALRFETFRKEALFSGMKHFERSTASL